MRVSELPLGSWRVLLAGVVGVRETLI